MQIGEIIKNLRIKNGFSQIDFANNIGESKQTVWKYENGVITNIPLQKIEKIAEVLHVSPSELTGWLPDEDPAPAADEDLAEILEEFRRRPEMKILFDSCKGASRESLEQLAKMVETFKNNSY